MKKLVVTMLFAMSALILMSGCSSSDSTPAPSTLSGTAATGAPIDGTVMVKDANGNEATVSTTGANGSFTLEVAGMTPPFLLKIMPADGTAPLYSYATEIGQTVNLTPTTNLAMFLASGKTDLDAMYGAWDGAAVSAAAVASAEGIVRANLATELTAAGLDAASIDLFTTPFSADGTGIDGVMDNLNISVDAGAGTFAFADGNGTPMAFDENITPLVPPAPADAISIATVSGATHALNGTYKSACYIGESGGSQFDSLNVNGSEWVNSANVYSNNDCTGVLTISAITATITKGADKQISGWLDGMGNDPGAVAAADGTTLSANETVTALSLVVASVTGTEFSGVPVGFTANIFYVFDDTGSGFIIYRDQDELHASTTDPYITR